MEENDNIVEEENIVFDDNSDEIISGNFGEERDEIESNPEAQHSTVFEGSGNLGGNNSYIPPRKVRDAVLNDDGSLSRSKSLFPPRKARDAILNDDGTLSRSKSFFPPRKARDAILNDDGSLGRSKNPLKTGNKSLNLSSVGGKDDLAQTGKGALTFAFKKLPLKAKLIIIGVLAGLIFVIIFLIILITPLMSLGIIEVEGIGGSEYSSNAYVNPTYSYCESINVEGQLYSLEEYVAGVVQAEVGAWLSDGVDEALKAQAIAARTYALYSTNGCKNPIANSQSAQTFNSNPSQEAIKIANDTAGLVLSYDNDLFLSQYDSFCYNDNDCADATINADGSYTVTYTRLPSGDSHSITLSDASYYNNIVHGGGHARGMSQLVSFQLAKEGNGYDDILHYFYSDGVEIVSLKKLSIGSESSEEGSGYIGTYTNLKSGKTYRNYKQYLYKGDEFTFDKKEKLANTGCGTTSAGIVLSGEDSSITPVTLFIEIGYVNSMGTHIVNHYSNGFKEFNYCTSWNDGWCNATNNSTKLSNSSTKQELINNLSSGGTAVLFISYKVDACLVNNESWTQSQHFFVALDYDESNNSIYISNPGTNNSTKNGWISLDALECVHISTLLYP